MTIRSLATALFAACLAQAAVEDGAAIYKTHCASCHESGASRTPTQAMLKKLPKESILTALQNGVMKAQGAGLSAAEKSAVAEYLGGAPKAAAAVSNTCASNPPLKNLDGWNGWGGGLSNSRFQDAEKAGVTAAGVPKLKLKWAFGFPDAITVFGQPALAGGRLFFGSSNGTVYSLDAATGCAYWTFRAPTTVRTAISVGTLPDGRYTAYFGDTHAAVYAVDAHSGELIWKTQVEDHKFARVTGAPKLVDGRLYVPVASGVEEMAAASPSYPCCTFRGSLVSLDAQTGKQEWKTYTLPDPPAQTGVNAAGHKKFGPSGASIWSSPTVDLTRRLIYVGTGNNYSDPGTPYSDAVLAFDMDSGSLKWAKQLTPGDTWNGGCITPDKKSCPEKPGEDTDIGASPILLKINGRDMLVVGQKSGVVYGIDPEKKGTIVWQQRIGKGGPLGGIMWGLAADNDQAYVPLSDFTGKPDEGGGMFAVRLTDGKVAWQTPAAKPACVGKAGCGPSQMAPATLIPGVVFSGSMDGHLRAYSTKDGSVVWDLDTLNNFETVNGVKAHGGSLNATGPVAGGGVVFFNSGYAQLGGMPGNVLLAFSVDGK